MYKVKDLWRTAYIGLAMPVLGRYGQKFTPHWIMNQVQNKMSWSPDLAGVAWYALRAAGFRAGDATEIVDFAKDFYETDIRVLSAAVCRIDNQKIMDAVGRTVLSQGICDSEFEIFESLWVQLNCETKFLEKWVTHFGFYFGGWRSVPGGGARLPQ